MHFFNPNYLSATIHSANVSVISQRARDVGFGTLDKLHIKGRKHRDGFVNVKGIYNADAHAAIVSVDGWGGGTSGNHRAPGRLNQRALYLILHLLSLSHSLTPPPSPKR